MRRLIIAGALALFSCNSLADDIWINRERRVDPVSKEWCCNDKDCQPVPVSKIREVKGGYVYIPTQEFIPNSRVQDSPDGEFWRCEYSFGQKYGQTRCFFRGIPGS
jgi:hypothetical protein